MGGLSLKAAENMLTPTSESHSVAQDGPKLILLLRLVLGWGACTMPALGVMSHLLLPHPAGRRKARGWEAGPLKTPLTIPTHNWDSAECHPTSPVTKSTTKPVSGPQLPGSVYLHSVPQVGLDLPPQLLPPMELTLTLA